MPWIEKALIIFAAALFLTALLLGLIFHRSRWWNWADPLYYLIGVAGVILLFSSNQRARELGDLRDELSTVQQKYDQELANPPKFGLVSLAPDELRNSYKKIVDEIKNGDYCKQPAVSGGVPCVIYKEHQEDYAAVFTGYSLPASNADQVQWGYSVIDYCNRGAAFVEKAANDSSFRQQALGSVNRAFADLAKRGDTSANLIQVKTELLQNLDKNKRNSLTLLSQDVNLASIKETTEIEQFFAISVFDAFAICSTIGVDERAAADRYANWQKDQKNYEARISDFRNQILALNQDDNSSASRRILNFVLSHLWPYVLTVGLAIKFAKGVAALRN